MPFIIYMFLSIKDQVTRRYSETTIRTKYRQRPATCLETKDLNTTQKSDNRQENWDLAQANASKIHCIECVKAVPVFCLDELGIGDHVMFDRGPYAHHGIIVSNIQDGKFKIIEATSTSEGLPRRMVDIVCSWKEFNLQEQRIAIVVYKNGRFSRMDTALNAMQYYRDVHFNRHYCYNLFFNNCEHFATFCATGHHLSLQVKKVGLVIYLFFTNRLRTEKNRNEGLFRKNIICEPCYEMNRNLLDVTHVPITNDEYIKIGDIIEYSYWGLRHNAVVLRKIETNTEGSLCSIAHYAFTNTPFSPKIIKVERKRIRFGRRFRKLDYAPPRYDVYAPEDVVRRAESMIGEQRFTYFSNDSCHFARWCELKLWTSQRNLERMTQHHEMNSSIELNQSSVQSNE